MADRRPRPFWQAGLPGCYAGRVRKDETRLRVIGGVAACALLAASPAFGALPVAAPAPAAAPDCAAVVAQRTALEAEHRAVRLAISDVALGRNRPKRKASAGDVGRAAAGTAASLLLPFGIGLAANAATAAASKSGKKKKRPPEPEVDVQAMIDRQQAVETRLRELGASGCAQPAPDRNIP